MLTALKSEAGADHSPKLGPNEEISLDSQEGRKENEFLGKEKRRLVLL